MTHGYQQPSDLREALSLLAGDDWKILAGGTDFYPGLQDAQFTGNVLDVSRIDGLDQIIREEAGCWLIGARATWSEVINADLPPAFDALKLAAREIGSIQIQNRATVVGNLCNASPAADGVPPLLAMDAQVRISSAALVRDVPLRDFIKGNRATDLKAGEMVTHLVIPSHGGQGVSSFLKLGARKYLVISISMVAVRLTLDSSGVVEDVAISVGSCSAVAQRLEALEKQLIGQSLQSGFVLSVEDEHLNTLSPIDDVRASGEYRLDATRELISRALIAAVNSGRNDD